MINPTVSFVLTRYVPNNTSRVHDGTKDYWSRYESEQRNDHESYTLGQTFVSSFNAPEVDQNVTYSTRTTQDIDDCSYNSEQNVGLKTVLFARASRNSIGQRLDHASQRVSIKSQRSALETPLEDHGAGT